MRTWAMSSSTRRPLRQTVALITQKTHVFAGTLADNLRLVRPDATDADLGTILDAIGAAAWVDLLSDCQHTRVGTGGHTLTASQAQYLALARVLLLTPEIVILDEATAEGGSGAARALDDAARTVVSGRSGLIIAHRLPRPRPPTSSSSWTTAALPSGAAIRSSLPATAATPSSAGVGSRTR